MWHSPIHVGNDFNVGKMAAVAAHHDKDNNKLYVMREFIDYLDTPELIAAIQEAFPGRKIFSYPDSSGKNRNTTDAKTSNLTLLRKAENFTVRVKSTNPLQADRIASVNRALEQGKLLINTEACIELTEALEQQIYLKNGSPDKESGIDHVLDALGYMVHYIMPVKQRGLTTIGVGQ